MKIRVEAKTGGLASLYTALNDVASGDTARAAAREAAGELQARVAAQFAASRDPYGVAWTPPKDGGKAGTRSGKLGGSVKVIARGPRLILSAPGVDYAKFFAYGTKKMGARPIFPEASIGLPPAWKSAIEAAFNRVVKAKLGKAAR